MRICLAAFTLFILMGHVKAADDEYPVTLEQARSWKLDPIFNDRYDSEFGDAKGPFKPVGGADSPPRYRTGSESAKMRRISTWARSMALC